MPNLLDAIQQNSNTLATQKQGMTDETGKLQALLRAKSGREVGGGDTAASNLGEQQAVVGTNAGMGQVANEATLQNAGIQAANQQQEQQVGAQKQQIAQNRNIDNMQTRMKTNEILQNLEQNKGKMDQQQRDAQVNQAVQNLRLQNTQYVDTLQREGDRARLDDQNSFNEALATSTFGANQELLQKSLGDKAVLDASDRDFKKAMGDMSVDNAYDIFSNQMKADKERGMYTAAGSLVTAGIGAAANADKMDFSSAPSSGVNTNSSAQAVQTAGSSDTGGSRGTTANKF